jgi:thymidylate synthase
MSKIESDYLNLLNRILTEGTPSEDRTGTGTLSLFGTQLRHNLVEGFPLLTTKKVFWKGVVAELLWFLTGSWRIKDLSDQGVKIWDAWDYPGKIVPYGSQWINWQGGEWKNTVKNGEDHIDFELKTVNQIDVLIKGLKEDPYSRRHIVSAWNVAQLDTFVLAPCHHFFQCYVRDNKLSLCYSMRSNDFFLGAPFNIASYALLTHMLAHVCGYEVGELIANLGDTHLYLNHLEQAKEQLSREPYPLPQLKIVREVGSIYNFKFEDFEIVGYQSHSSIKAPIAI